MLDPFRDRLDGEPEQAASAPQPSAPAPSLREELLGISGGLRPPARGAEDAAPVRFARD